MLTTRTSEARDWHELEAVKAWLGITGPKLDPVLGPLVRASLDAVELYLGTAAAVRVYSERFGPYLAEAPMLAPELTLELVDLPSSLSVTFTAAGAGSTSTGAVRLLDYSETLRRAELELNGGVELELEPGTFAVVSWSVVPPADGRDLVAIARNMLVGSWLEGREGQGGDLPAAVKAVLDLTGRRRVSL